MSIKPGDSGVVIGYQVDEFTHTWSAEYFTLWYDIGYCFTGKVATLINFPLELGHDDYSFLDQVVEDFEHGLDSILTDSINTPEMDASFDEADDIPFSVFSGFLHLVSSVFDNSRLQIAPSISSQIVLSGCTFTSMM